MLAVNFDRSKEMITTRLNISYQQVFSLKNKYKGKNFFLKYKKRRILIKEYYEDFLG